MRERVTLIRVFEELRALGYEGGFDAVRRCARRWGEQHTRSMAEAYVQLTFRAGRSLPVRRSHEIVVIDGVTMTVKVANIRLCHSRMMFVRTYSCKAQEMVFDAHERAFAFFRGTCRRGLSDNKKTAVETVFISKDRGENEAREILLSEAAIPGRSSRANFDQPPCAFEPESRARDVATI